jgi:superfamily I DNA/RNA helicase
VQRQNANYMGRYIAKAIADIPHDEMEEAVNNGYPAVLVVVAQPYRDQITDYLTDVGYAVDTKRDSERKLDREYGLAILKEDQKSNLGWRVVLEEEQPSFVAGLIAKTADATRQLKDVLPDNYRNRVMAEVDAWEPTAQETRLTQATDRSGELSVVRVTSFEGAKGLSAQHVFLVGLHDSEIPRDPNRIQDIEICKFVVGLTRTRKKCTLVHTRRFADQWKSRSTFISWIEPERFESITVDKTYWSSHKEVPGRPRRID